MKKILILLFSLFTLSAAAQTSEMEKRYNALAERLAEEISSYPKISSLTYRHIHTPLLQMK